MPTSLLSGISTRLLRPTVLAGAFMLATSAMAQSGSTFKIGMTTDMSSAYSDITGKGSAIAVQMAIDDFGGTVLGKKIELLVADHQMKPSVGAPLITQWFDRDGVSMIAGLAGSSVALAAQAIAKDRPTRTLLHTVPLSSELIGKSCLPNAIHWAPDSYALAAAVTRNVTEKGSKNWFLMVQDTAAGPPARAAAGLRRYQPPAAERLPQQRTYLCPGHRRCPRPDAGGGFEHRQQPGTGPGWQDEDREGPGGRVCDCGSGTGRRHRAGCLRPWRVPLSRSRPGARRCSA